MYPKLKQIKPLLRHCNILFSVRNNNCSGVFSSVPLSKCSCFLIFHDFCLFLNEGKKNLHCILRSQEDE